MPEDQLKGSKHIATIATTIIGAGILAVPIPMAALGAIPGAIVLTIVGLAFLYTAYYIGEATIAANSDISLTGLAEKHFGKPGLVVMIAGVLVYIYGALIGYLSAGGQVANDLTGGAISQPVGTMIYFVLGALVVYLGIRALETSAFWLSIGLAAAFIGLVILTIPHLSGTLLARTDNSKLLSVLGVIFFAYNGHSVIPSIANQYKGNFRAFKKICFLGVFYPFLLYVIWCVIVIGSIPFEATAGAERLTTASIQDAQAFGQPSTIPLGHLFGTVIIFLGGAFSLFATFTSFIGFGYSLAENFVDLFKKAIPWIGAVALTVIPPLVFNFVNRDLFLRALDVAGTYGAGVFAGIMPCLIILKVRREQLRRPLTLGEKAGPYLILAFFVAFLTYATIQIFS